MFKRKILCLEWLMKTPSPSLLTGFSLTKMACPWSGFAEFLLVVIGSAILAFRPLSPFCQVFVTRRG